MHAARMRGHERNFSLDRLEDSTIRLNPNKSSEGEKFLVSGVKAKQSSRILEQLATTDGSPFVLL